MGNLSRRIFLDRYALKDNSKELFIGDTAIVVVKDDPKWPITSVGKISSICPGIGAEVVVTLDEPTWDGTALVTSLVVKREGLSIPIELEPRDTWLRVAHGLAAVEDGAVREALEAEFFSVLEDWKLVPGGRILATAGTSQLLTMFNCYVIPSPKDSRGGIVETLGRMVEIMSHGGGVGINVSSLRPSKARIVGVNGRSSGAVSWGALYSFATGLISQGGSRRGALLLALNDWHPDLLEFINAKKQAGFIENANMSVAVSDAFMTAARNRESWILKFPDTTHPMYDSVWEGDIHSWEGAGYPVVEHGTIDAYEVLRVLTDAAWASAEPGILWLDRSNKMHNGRYFQQIISTNPSLRRGTRVLTNLGIVPIEELEGKQFLVPTLENVAAPATCILSGRDKPLYKIVLNNGAEYYATKEHKWPVLRESAKYVKIMTDELQPGDYLPLTAIDNLNYGTVGDYEDGFLLGYLYGDGNVTSRVENGREYNQYGFTFGGRKVELGLMDRILTKLKLITGVAYTPTERVRDGVAPWYEVHASNPALNEYMRNLGVSRKSNGFPTIVFKDGSEELRKGFVDGMFSTDGCVTDKRVIFTSSSTKLIHDMSDLLGFYGIRHSLRRGNTALNGKTFTRYDITLGGHALRRFEAVFKLSHTDKHEKLQTYVAINIRKHVISTHSTIVSVELTDLKEDVWDLQIEDNSHTFRLAHCVTGNCGEIPLAANGVCCLAHLNLAKVFDATTGKVDWKLLQRIIITGYRALDNVIDVTPYFDAAVEEEAKSTRRIGMGTMGLAELLIHLTLPYRATPKTLAFIDRLYGFITCTLYEASSNMAVVKGSFPAFDADKFLESGFAKTLPERIRNLIRKQGLRNVCLTTQAPTGSTGSCAGTSTGIEPFFAVRGIERKSRLGTDSQDNNVVEKWILDNPGKKLPNYFVGAMDITAEDHIRIQAVIQRWTDSSISKTVNVPSTTTKDEIFDLHLLAYDLGCKGVTIYRDGSRDSQPLTVNAEAKVYIEDDETVAAEEVDGPQVIFMHGARRCPACGNISMFDADGCEHCEVCGAGACSR